VGWGWDAWLVQHKGVLTGFRVVHRVGIHGVHCVYFVHGVSWGVDVRRGNPVIPTRNSCFMWYADGESESSGANFRGQQFKIPSSASEPSGARL
jgi:hypothetical protein